MKRYEDLHVAIFGAIYQGDPISIDGRKVELVGETLYPPLEALANHFGYDPQFIYEKLIKEGRVSFRCNEELVVATTAYFHDNNTTSTRQ